MNRHYTSIEQSKRLLELGLKPETCDKVWVLDKGAEVEFTLDLMDEEDYNKYVYTYPNDMYVPCWSEGALLELLPKNIEDSYSDLDYRLKIDMDDKMPRYAYIDDCYHESFPWDFEHRNLLDNLVDSVIWLLENKYI